MALDQIANFVRGSTDAATDSTQTTISVVDASVFPDPANGEYNLVLWYDNSYPRPDQDPDVEIVRVTARDTGVDELTVTRGQEDTSGASHPSGSAVHLSPTAKMFTDIEDSYTRITETEKVSSFEENDITTTLTNISIGGGSIELTTPFFDITQLTFLQSITPQDSISEGVAWNNDGSKLYEVGRGEAQFYEYNVSTPFDISTATFSQSISTEDGNPQDIEWNNDGSKLYGIDFNSNNINEYNVSTPFDISTATFSQSISTQGTSGQGLAWNDDGSKLYNVDGDNDMFYEYNVSTPFDISTATFSQSEPTENGDPTDMVWNNDGTKLYDIGFSPNEITEYDADAPFDISTITVSQSIPTQSDFENGITWDSVGKNLYEVSGSEIYQSQTPTAETNGEALVEIEAQTDIVSWDIATQQKTLDGETVTVDIEDESGNVLLSDIGRNVDISSIGPSTNIQFRATLQRDNTDNNPTLDFLARRYEQ